MFNSVFFLAYGILSFFVCSASAFLPINNKMQPPGSSVTMAQQQEDALSSSSSQKSNGPPFQLQRIDHVVIRCANFAPMFDFYHRILGCTVDEPTQDHLNRFGGALTHLRAGNCYIDLLAYDPDHLSNDGRNAITRFHAGGQGIASGVMEDVQFSSDTSTMDHLCLRVEPFDEQRMLEYLEKENVSIAASGGDRLGADGVGKSIYVRDPEGNVIELKGPPNAGPGRNTGDDAKSEEKHISAEKKTVGGNKSMSSDNAPLAEANEESDVPATPCIRICRYNASFHNGQVCIGCYREAYEIQSWQSMTALEKSMTLLDAIDRCEDNNNTFDGAISKDELIQQYKHWERLSRRTS
ncbi:hypothetical protein HJC23_014092 [Cyclotella cryptica]|uniref:VOC domain-containing protein n=1 Tax=Cyclotella cryptica TaxID=29204 RepID=A0ABD3QT66_9STRA|eukprot:CCRYP_002482-RA/>CCRYP_002482-RA protein AED:0.12 eAED:0.12 QI:0/-1/0/1/-1/1/1/0/351